MDDGLVVEPPSLSLEKTGISFVERGTRHTVGILPYTLLSRVEEEEPSAGELVIHLERGLHRSAAVAEPVCP